MTTSMKMTVFWSVEPYNLIDIIRRFGGAYRFLYQGDRVFLTDSHSLHISIICLHLSSLIRLDKLTDFHETWCEYYSILDHGTLVYFNSLRPSITYVRGKVALSSRSRVVISCANSCRKIAHFFCRSPEGSLPCLDWRAK
jgi:hypothetical protein